MRSCWECAELELCFANVVNRDYVKCDVWVPVGCLVIMEEVAL